MVAALRVVVVAVAVAEILSSLGSEAGHTGTYPTRRLSSLRAGSMSVMTGPPSQCLTYFLASSEVALMELNAFGSFYSVTHQLGSAMQVLSSQVLSWEARQMVPSALGCVDDSMRRSIQGPSGKNPAINASVFHMTALVYGVQPVNNVPSLDLSP